jgi:hypothetical protein
MVAYLSLVDFDRTAVFCDIVTGIVVPCQLKLPEGVAMVCEGVIFDPVVIDCKDDNPIVQLTEQTGVGPVDVDEGGHSWMESL